tara:strand:+ start:4234 stop:5694 length:1461 start_codon:yes stop_codon:yes gene_type:complete
MLKDIYYFSTNQIINISLYLLFVILYFFHFDYILSHRDEIYYLSDSLLLIEGYKPSFSHSPSGLSTWIGSIYVLCEFVIKNIFSIDNFLSIKKLFLIFDLHLAEHYQDLRKIKITLIIFNSLLLFYILLLSKKNNLFFSIFILLFTLPYFINLSLSGTPYFLASILLIISLLLKQTKPTISIIFFGLCVAERLEYILFLLIFLDKENFKKNFNTLGLFLLVFFTTSPWFLFSILQNIKVLITYVASTSESVLDKDNNLFKFTKYLIILIYCILTIILTIVKKRNSKYILLILLISNLLILIFIFHYPVRWFIPFFVYLSYMISKYISVKNIKLINFFVFGAVLLFMTIFLFKDKKSESEILNNQVNLNQNVIGLPLLREKSNFTEFVEIWGKHLFIENIKNNKYFDNANAPLVFGETGNLEKIQFRRYQYISKYFNKHNSKKYIYGKSGLYFTEYNWCELLEKNTEKKVYYFNTNNYIYLDCYELP